MTGRPWNYSSVGVSVLGSCTVLFVAVGWLAAATRSQMTLKPAAGTVSPPPFRFGVSARVFLGFNKNDAKAALRVWAQKVANEHGFRVAPPQVLNGGGALRQALVEKRVDGVGIGVDEYWGVRQFLSSRYYFADIIGGDIYEHYLLLVRQGSGITNLAGLRQRTLREFENPQMSLARPWLNTVLIQKGFPAAGRLLSQITASTKLTHVILPVFFGQADACLVTRKGFEVMTELNPQVGQQLHVLAVSPKLIAGGFFLRADYPTDWQDILAASVVHVGDTPAGRQVLTVFHTEGMVKRPISSLASSLRLLDTYHRLLHDTSTTRLPGTASSAK